MKRQFLNAIFEFFRTRLTALNFSGLKIASGTSLVAQTVKNLSAMQETRVLFLGWEDPLENGMVTHSSTLAWKTPWMVEPGRLQSGGHKESDTTE